MKKLIYILAANVAEAKVFMDANGLSFADVRYLPNEVAARGLKDVDFVIVGTFWKRGDARPIYDSIVLSGGRLSPLSPQPLPVGGPQAPLSTTVPTPTKVVPTKPRKARLNKTTRVPPTLGPIVLEEVDERDDVEPPKPEKSRFMFKKILSKP